MRNTIVKNAKILFHFKYLYSFYFFLFYKNSKFIFSLKFFNKKKYYLGVYNKFKMQNTFVLKKNINFFWYKFVLFSGLGFKKKISKLKNFIYLYIGDRH